MKVYFHELKDQELSYSFDESTPWVMEVVGALDERMDRIQRPPNWKPRTRPTEVSFTLRGVEDLVQVSGKVKTQLYMYCSLCADPFQFPISAHFHVLLTQSEMYADTPRETAHKGATHGESGFEDEDGDDELSGPAMNMSASDFEVTVVKEPVADLKEILNEQLVLLIPIQPKPDRKENGDCVKCGRNQMMYSVQTEEEPLRENPFGVLKNFGKKPNSG